MGLVTEHGEAVSQEGFQQKLLEVGDRLCDGNVGWVVFDQRQGLWFMRRGWEEAIKAPSTRDFFAWLKTQHNGAKPGESPPA